MPKTRRKISAVVRDFFAELRRLEKLDAQNQAGLLPSSPQNITRHQLHFLTEAIFFRAFRAYESFIRDTFLLYCLEASPRSGAKVRSFLKPIKFSHAEQLIQSSMPHLDWTNPDILIPRAETYLKEGFPIKLAYTSHREELMDFKRIRNHIAHDSNESLQAYKIVLRKYHGTIPLTIPSPGQFLLLNDRIDPSKYILLTFFDLLRTLSNALT